MAKKMDPLLIEILTKFGEDVERAVWDCHGVWVAYHKAIERIAAKAGIVFDMPMIVEANTPGKAVSIAVRGTMSDRAEWSFGEASAANCKNSYYYAMAEKRAKDRVVLKLIGLHGLVYSEEESDDFKPGSTPAQEAPEKRVVGFRTDGTRTPHSLRKEGVWQVFMGEVEECQTTLALTRLAAEWSLKAETDKWPEEWKELAREEINKHRKLLASRPAPDEDHFPGDPVPAAMRREILNHPVNGG